MCEKQTEMNRRIVALRDSKVRLVLQLKTQAQELQKVQQRLAAHLHRPPPSLPSILPEETPEKKLRYSRATLERYRVLREQRYSCQCSTRSPNNLNYISCSGFNMCLL